MRICVCTTNSACREPRAPRHAVALAGMSDEHEVVFLDCLPRGTVGAAPFAFAGKSNLAYRSCYYPHRGSGILSLALDKLRTRCSGSLSVPASRLVKALRSTAADAYYGHNIDTLRPICEAAEKNGALVLFDSMEFYSDMGDSQTASQIERIRQIERTYLGRCSLITTSSPQIAEALSAIYGVTRMLPLYNAPPIWPTLPPKKTDTFSLYWRNAVIGLSQRGLEDALLALKQLPEDIALDIQGRLPADGGRALTDRIRSLNLAGRVGIHEPFQPHEAVAAASPYSVGLCLERPGIRNHELTVSNKMFDYFMAGLAVIASDLPGLRSIITRSGAGLLFQAGEPDDLAAKVLQLYEDRKLFWQCAHSARSFALSEGNAEHEMQKLLSAFESLTAQEHPVTAP